MNAPGSPPLIILSRVPPDEIARYGAHFAAIEKSFSSAGIPVTVVDSIYDMQREDAGAVFLREATTPLVILGWHYPRAMKWLLATLGVNLSLVRLRDCFDLRALQPEQAVAAVRAILNAAQAVQAASPAPAGTLPARWYPVLDYDACTNCMACLDFCLFGVYGVDRGEVLRVVSPDQCRQDCPACARVCPVSAIIFPKYRANAAIAGDATADAHTVKLDLSIAFGKPGDKTQADAERNQALSDAGRKPPATEQIRKLADEFGKLDV